jgi:hypothetical protein
VTLLLALSLAGAAIQAAPADSFRAVQVGDVRVVAVPARIDAAIRLAEFADRPTTWPGLGSRAPDPFQLVLVADSAELGKFSRGRAPSWGAAVAFPQSRTIVLRADLPDLEQTLRHEVAHLMLRGAIRSRVPLWFDEGYATLAAGEWDRLARLELHLSVVLTGVPALGDLDGQLRGNSQMADRAYGLAATAVTSLTARIPGNDLAPLFARLGAGEEFTAAVHDVTGKELSRVESEWRDETRRNFRGGLWLAAGGWWLVAAAAVVAAWSLRRRRERPRRSALDVGWELPPEEVAGEGEMSQPAAPIDPDRRGM